MAHYEKLTFSAFAKLTLQSLKNDNLHILDRLDFSMLLCWNQLFGLWGPLYIRSQADYHSNTRVSQNVGEASLHENNSSINLGLQLLCEN